MGLKKCILAAVLIAAFGTANAVPIVYTVLQDGVPATGQIEDIGEDNPEQARYFLFFANAGDRVEVFGDRLEGAYDMAFWMFSGMFADTDDFQGSLAIDQEVDFQGSQDDEDPPNIAGPFGDPRFRGALPVTGFYTVAVTSGGSSNDPGPDGVFDFRLQMNVVPEPGLLALLGIGLAGLGVLRRRNS